MRAFVALSIVALVLVACVPTSVMVTAVPTSIPTNTSEWTAEPTVFIPATEAVAAATLTPIPYYGYLQFPFLNADAGNFQLQTGATIPFTWIDPPPGAMYYEIVLYPLDGSAMISLGRDSDPSDGVTLEWTVAPDLAAEVKAYVYYDSDQPVLTISALFIYSPSMSQ